MEQPDRANADVVIVGGGPVGLWTAIQLKLRRPEWQVVLYERHTTYARSHVLRLDHWSLLLYGRHRKGAHDEVRRKLYEAITGKQLSRVAMQPASSLYIRTNELEAVLREYSSTLGVELVHLRIDHPSDVRRLHPGCHRFIAADGAHSTMRAALLGPDSVRNLPLRHVVEVKYEVQGTGQRLSAFSGQFKANRRLRNMVFEYVGKPKNGVAPVTLRFFVSKATYEELGEASFKAPLTLSDPRVPDSLRSDIAAYLKVRIDAAAEEVCRESVRLTKLTLSMYHAREFVIRSEQATWFLVGDAAMGVPYFRALNSGLILASRLAQIMCARSWPINGKLQRQERFYRWHQPLHVYTEFAIARGKDAILTGYDWARQIAFGGVVSAEEGATEDVEYQHALDIDCWKTPQ